MTLESNNLISFENVYFSYGQNEVIKNLSFDIKKGEFVGIIGPNGTGKSTMIKLMVCIHSPQKGKITIFNQDSSCCNQLYKIGYVPQSTGSGELEFPATVEEVVMLNIYKEIGHFRLPSKKHKEKVKKALELVDMEKFSKRKISELSGGQKQRVIIAKALVNEPEILVLDEPTTGIDAASERLLYSILDKLNRENNITIIMISHDIKKIKSHASKIISLEEELGGD